MSEFTRRDENGTLQHVRLDGPLDAEFLCRMVLLAVLILLIIWKIAALADTPIGAGIASGGVLYVSMIAISAQVMEG